MTERRHIPQPVTTTDELLAAVYDRLGDVLDAVRAATPAPREPAPSGPPVVVEPDRGPIIPDAPDSEPKAEPEPEPEGKLPAKRRTTRRVTGT